MYRSTDGGDTWQEITANPGAHGLWIDPKQPQRMINGNAAAPASPWASRRTPSPVWCGRTRSARGCSSPARRRVQDAADLPGEGRLPHVRQGPGQHVDAGTNRFVWNMRYPDAEDVPGNVMWRGSVTGPVAAPGTYRVELVVGDKSLSESFEIRKDPRIPATSEELQEQFDLLIKVRDKLNETHGAINQVRDVRGQVDTWVKLAAGHKDAAGIAKAADHLKGRLTAVEEALMQVKSKSHEDPLNFPMQLNNKLATIADVVAMDDHTPTKQSYEAFIDLSAKIDAQLAQLQVLAEAVPAFTGRGLRSGRSPHGFVRRQDPSGRRLWWRWYRRFW